MPDALAEAAQGKQLSEKKANTAVQEALDRLGSMKKRAEGMKEKMAETGTAVLETGIVQATCFGASFAVGAAGDKWAKPGGYVDVRPVVAAGLATWGFYDVVSGGDKGGLILAAANGIGASWLGEVGKSAGEAMAKKWAETPAAGAQGAQTPPAAGTPQVGQQSRDVRLTPERRGLRRRRDDEYAD